MAQRQALGKGLSALIPNEGGANEDNRNKFFLCPIDKIEPNPYQPRKIFKGTELDELAESVKRHGILTPILIRRKKQDSHEFYIIAGERRWRAAQRAGLDKIPVVVKEADQDDFLHLALVENIHREDLNPMEEASAYKLLMESQDLTHEKLAEILGKSRSTITNMLRLLDLPGYIQEDVLNEVLSMGHARVLAGIQDLGKMRTIRNMIIEKGLSVRQVESYAASTRTVRNEVATVHEESDPSYIRVLSEDLKRHFGTKVDITKRSRSNRGKIVIHFNSNEELDRLLDIWGINIF